MSNNHKNQFSLFGEQASLSEDEYYQAALRALQKNPVPTPGRYAKPTVDQFWEELGQVGDGEDDGSRMGHVITKLLDEGRMRHALDEHGNERTRKSLRPATHGRSVYIWVYVP